MKTALCIEKNEDKKMLVKHVEGGIEFSISFSSFTMSEPIVVPTEELEFFIDFLQKPRTHE